MRQKQSIFSLFLLSPSSRRAWIEIQVKCVIVYPCIVALLAEGVDRNYWAGYRDGLDKGRPPRGGRG